jgi:hypothetical protein
LLATIYLPKEYKVVYLILGIQNFFKVNLGIICCIHAGALFLVAWNSNSKFEFHLFVPFS